ncbi:hypothetical protein Mapa_002034 [Marchantia paleacea]|nr:hypothetical protein Mapa_002034 [Marchantia paleacea]
MRVEQQRPHFAMRYSTDRCPLRFSYVVMNTASDLPAKKKLTVANRSSKSVFW